MDIVEFLRARLDEEERHARKDLWALDQATAAGRWSARYGYNLPESFIEEEAAGVTIAAFVANDALPLPDGAERQHAKDAFLVSRLVRTARGRAERVLAEVAAKRAIVDLYEHARAREVSEPGEVGFARYAEALEHVVQSLAAADAGHPDYREEWRP